jgi:hypothetical protein
MMPRMSINISEASKSSSKWGKFGCGKPLNQNFDPEK